MTRPGKAYIEGLRDGRRIFVDGECVQDVTEHPAFRGAVRSIANNYDLVHESDSDSGLTFVVPETGNPANVSFLIPRSAQDLTRRRLAMRKIAEQSLGFMGRGPEHVAGFLAGWASRKDIFGANERVDFGANIERFYRHVRDEDLYCTYAIVPPQIDRSKPAHQQADPYLYAGVKSESDEGIVVAGAQMLATGAAIADYVVLSCITPLQSGDEAYAISVAVSVGAPGVRVLSRRSYAEGATSVYDYPLSARFDETDALIVFDDVFVPWERVFVYRDLKTVSDQWNRTPAHLLGNNQAQARLSTKVDFMCGLATKIAEMNGSVAIPPVRELLGRMAAHSAMISSLLVAQEVGCEIDDHDVAWPGRAACFAAMTAGPDIYADLISLLRELCGGGLIQLPSSEADFANAQASADIDRFVQSPGWTAYDRVKLLKLAWDVVGSEFGSRHQQYEMFYAGAPFIVRSRMAQAFDFESCKNLVESALARYDSAVAR